MSLNIKTFLQFLLSWIQIINWLCQHWNIKFQISASTELFIIYSHLSSIFTCLMSILFYSKLKAYLSELGVSQKFSFPAFVLSQKFSYTYFWNIFSPKVFHFPKLVLLTFYKVSTSFVVVRSNLLLLILIIPILDQEWRH